MYLVDAFVVVEDALDVANQFGEIVLAQFLDDVAVFADAELVDEADEVGAACLAVEVPGWWLNCSRTAPRSKKNCPIADSFWKHSPAF